jgi:pilus assembly protein CpaD
MMQADRMTTAARIAKASLQVPSLPVPSLPVPSLPVRAALALTCVLFVCGCNTDQQVAGVPDVPADYRMRHPITMKESDHTLQVFIGSNRGELNPTQRAQVLDFGLKWKREATGGIVISRPVGSSNERAAADALREISSILAASGMPPQSVAVRTYPANGPALAPVNLSYPKISAQAGPCGIWPEDIGPSANRDYFENQPMWNNGCASQRNLAAMVDNPADLVQPRAETPAYTMRRTTVMEKYREGIDTATQESASASSAKISDVGK